MGHRRATTLLLPAMILFFLGCGERLGRVGSYTFGDDLTQDRPIEAQGEESLTDERDGGPADGGEDPYDTYPNELDMALEELEMEDSDALTAIIRKKLSAAEVEESYSADLQGIPPAHLNLALSKRECKAKLKEYDVRFKEPDFDTPGVGAPILLKGPMGGVSIEPKWPQSKGTNAVMDCHLALALVEVARQARKQGIEKILFYSTYRPLKPPPGKCKRGRAGKRCRRLKESYKKAKKNPSRHRGALAIDIGWLVTDEGETIDVLEHFDRKSKKPPCEYEASTKEGRVLSKFVCDLYDARIFNVLLTPNFDKAHHNHFHFDLTPKASWYIIR